MPDETTTEHDHPHHYSPFTEDEIRALVRRVVREELERELGEERLMAALEKVQRRQYTITRRAYSGLRSCTDD